MTIALGIRPARSDDYAAFAHLQPQMGSGDPTPGEEAWLSNIAPGTLVATLADKVAGYCFWQEYDDTGYVRNVVVDSTARRMGIGRALMRATAAHLRARGKTSWRLNVKPDNVAAIALYASMGMQTAYAGKAFLLPWRAVASLPSYGAAISVARADRDAALEAAFALPAGQLARSRLIGRTIFEASDSTAILGFADFNPRFPGAFPFRVVDPRVARDLLTAMRALVPADDAVNLTVEDDEPLAILFLQAGARLRMEILHMVGGL
jgi:GNAT superfamily N-acetyltransferase